MCILPGRLDLFFSLESIIVMLAKRVIFCATCVKPIWHEVREAVQSDKFLMVYFQMLHKCDNY